MRRRTRDTIHSLRLPPYLIRSHGSAFTGLVLQVIWRTHGVNGVAISSIRRSGPGWG